MNKKLVPAIQRFLQRLDIEAARLTKETERLTSESQRLAGENERLQTDNEQLNVRVREALLRIAALEGDLRSRSRDSDLGRQALERLYQGDLDGAGQIMDQLIAADTSRLVEDHISRARIYALQDNARKCLEHFENAYRLSPNDLDLAFAVGRMLLETEQFPRAIEVFKNALPMARQAAFQAEDPLALQRYAGNLNNLGTAYQKVLSFEQAAECLEEARKEFANLVVLRGSVGDMVHFTMVLYNLGHLYDQLDRVADAENKLRAVVEIIEMNPTLFYPPQRVKALLSVASFYLRRQCYGDALHHSQAALELSKGWKYSAGVGVSEFQLAQAYRAAGRISEATDAARQAADVFRAMVDRGQTRYERNLDLADSLLRELHGATVH